MNCIHVKGKLGNYELNLPTKFTDVTPEYLTKVTEPIKVAPNYALVGLVYVDKLSYLLNANKRKQNANIRCVPVFVKLGDCEQKFANSLVAGNKLVVSGSDLAMGHHVNAPSNKITVDNIVNLILQDPNATKDSWSDPNVYYFVEFKLIPVSAIHGVILDTEVENITTYVKKETLDDVELN